MTQYQINSIKSAKKTSEKLLAKELAYSLVHQNKNIISMHHQHIAKMENLLKA